MTSPDLRRRPMRPTVLVLTVFLTATGTMALASPSEAQEPTAEDPAAPNVLLITVDTLRGDALGWIGGRNETPAIDALAKGGARFRSAVSPVPITLPAHASILTGLIPARHGIRDNGQTVPAGFPTLAERLSAEGWHTAAFVSGFPLESIFGLDRGFDHYDDTMDQGTEGWVERAALDTTAAAVEWILASPSPWFVWIHFYDPHDPYEPPRTFWQQGEQGDYLGEVAYTDFAIETLLDGIPQKLRANTLTVFTADHGESLGEHREKTHGFFVYDSTVVVPLVFHQPGRIKARELTLEPRLVDIAPTVLDLLRLPPMAGIDGVSLAPSLLGRSQKIPPAVIETHLPWIFFGWSPLTGLRDGGWKYIDAPTPELYHLAKDPRELQNLALEHPDRATGMRDELRAIVPEDSKPTSSVADQETIDALRALGYIGAGETPAAEPGAGLADPKDRIDLRNRLQDAEAALRAGAFDRAIAEFQAVLEVEPTNRYAALRIGIAYLKWNKPAEAIPRLERSVELDPDRAEARYALADALMRTERFSDSAAQWREVTRLQPRRADAWFNLALAAAKSGDQNTARSALQKAMDTDDTGDVKARINNEPDLKKLLRN
ncbi:MAG: sulfatase-like hydrolase/transferase [Candidatus Sulfomarinibacteraceae bacterium]